MPTLNKGDSKLSTNVTLSKQDPSTTEEADCNSTRKEALQWKHNVNL